MLVQISTLETLKKLVNRPQKQKLLAQVEETGEERTKKNENKKLILWLTFGKNLLIETQQKTYWRLMKSPYLKNKVASDY